MTMSEYLEQTKNFLRKANATMEIKVVGPDFPNWDEDHIHLRHNVTITTPRGKYTFPFWGSRVQAELNDLLVSREKFAKRKYNRHFGDLSMNEKMAVVREVDYERDARKITEYDVLACMTKYDPGTHEDFCHEFGYDTDSIKGLETYLAVQEEWNGLRRIFTPEQLEELTEIQ